MEELVVNDTNILIDLADIGLASYCRDMNITFHTTNVVIRELNNARQRAAIEPLLTDGTLVENIFDGEDTIDFVLLYQDYHQISNLTPADCSVMKLAEMLQCRLLTNDQKLRRYASQRGIVVNGLLWLTDRMVVDGIVTPLQMANSLQELIRINPSAPRELIMERIDAYIRDNNNI